MDCICDNTVIVRDFNCIFSSILDRSPPTQNQAQTSKRAKAILDTCNELDLVESWHVLHSKDKEFTFIQLFKKRVSQVAVQGSAW